MKATPIVVRRFRDRTVYQRNGIQFRVFKREQATDYSINYLEKKKKAANAQHRAAPLRAFPGPPIAGPPAAGRAILNISRRKVMRRAANLRGQKAMQRNQAHATIDLSSSVPRPRKIKNNRQLRKFE